ncbi:hypothetical protein BJQ94_14315 [Cryobacterium sp. SO2]|uniref:hypothetical protein n=1 Tax=Cryobacterium sp. SO2 TaxID=1897060 RepID=UPI00223CFE7A|nr:hypothetical protein [Cryobacterium sp. SO2]WEO76531.1 hypothetical protein BJQ94_14315 [Cryobacterium sp. SO2]
MTHDTIQPKTQSQARRRWMRAAGWTLVALGVIVSWVWSVELTIRGESVNASIAGAATLLLFCAGITLIWRVSPNRGRRPTLAFRAAVIATALGAIIAGVVPVAVIAATTGTVTADVTSGTSGPDYTVSGVAVVSSDAYNQTTLDLTVSASDRTTPLLEATVSFADGTADVTCANTRPTWTHDVSTVTLACDSFTPIASLRTVAGIAVTER